MSELARPLPALRPAQPNPLATLPKALVAPATRFYGFYCDSLKGTTGLVTRLRHWMAEEGVTEADADLAMRRLMSPEAAAKSTYAGQVLAELAAVVVAVREERLARERQEAQRRRADAERDAAAPPGDVRRLIGDLFKPREA